MPPPRHVNRADDGRIVSPFIERVEAGVYSSGERSWAALTGKARILIVANQQGRSAPGSITWRPIVPGMQVSVMRRLT